MMATSDFKEELPQLPYVTDNVYVAVVKDPTKMIDGKPGRGFYYTLVEYIDRIHRLKTEEFEGLR